MVTVLQAPKGQKVTLVKPDLWAQPVQKVMPARREPKVIRVIRVTQAQPGPQARPDLKVIKAKPA
jgi:hypothetical protein